MASASHITVFDPRGGLVFKTNGCCPVWSPNGRRIAVLAHSDLYLMHADGTKARRIRDEAWPYDWSPDGRLLLIGQDSEEKHASVMTVVRADGRLVRTLGVGYGPDWFGPAPTRTTVNAAPEPVTEGKRLAVVGRVTKLGIGLYRGMVKIRFKAAGARHYTTVRRSTTTDAIGRFETTVTARRTGTWKAVHPATAATFTSHGTDKVKVRR